MKKAGSILVVLLLVGTFLNISVAVHYCSGKLASTRISFTGEKATCGMVHSSPGHTQFAQLSSNCCRDEITVLSVVDNYTVSQLQMVEFLSGIFQLFAIPVNVLPDLKSILRNIIPDSGPPGSGLTSAVDLSDICILKL